MSTATLLPVPRKTVLDIAHYVPGKSTAPSGVKLYKLSANESSIGPSPLVHDAMTDALARIQTYPDGQATALKTAIAERYGLNPRHIICGNGSDEVMSLTAFAYLGEGLEGIHTQHGFALHRTAILAAGAQAIEAPERDARVDVDAILDRVTERTRLVFIANPGNPTGTYIPFSEVRRLHAVLPGNVVLVLDAAYAEYVRRNDYEAGIELVATSQNVVMTRTFSKIHGLAALRVGWMYAPEAIIDAVERIRPPFNINALAIAAAAAAMRDTDHVERSIRHNLEWSGWLTAEFERLGLTVTPSVTNFLLIHFPATPGRDAAAAEAFLTSRGYVLRNVKGYGFPNALRLTIASEEANRGVAAALGAFMESTR